MNVITVVEQKHARGTYKVTSSVLMHAGYASSAGEAAALAVNYSELKRGGFVILGCDEVLDKIPENFRKGA